MPEDVSDELSDDDVGSDCDGSDDDSCGLGVSDDAAGVLCGGLSLLLLLFKSSILFSGRFAVLLAPLSAVPSTALVSGRGIAGKEVAVSLTTGL